MLLTANNYKNELKKLADPQKARLSLRFFKTGPGEYGEGDKFIGVNTPEQRAIAKNFLDLSLSELQKMLNDELHEMRFGAVVILSAQMAKTKDKNRRREIFDFYLNNLNRINNWDLIDVSAGKVVGEYLLDQPRDVLYQLAKSKHLWSRRAAIIATFAFIRRDQLDDTFALAEKLLTDQHDLMHKAVGWALREAGKKDEKRLKLFLNQCLKNMPRTTLRYAIEKFSENERKIFLKK